MFRLVVKGANVRQVAAEVEARSNTLLALTVRIVRHPTFTDEWVVDIIGQPGDTVIRSLLNAGYCERMPFTPPFHMGALLFWSEVPSTLLSVKIDSEGLVSEAIVSGMRFGEEVTR